MTAPRLASIASSQSAKNTSGFSATPSRDNSSYTTTLRTFKHLRLTWTLPRDQNSEPAEAVPADPYDADRHHRRVGPPVTTAQILCVMPDLPRVCGRRGRSVRRGGVGAPVSQPSRGCETLKGILMDRATVTEFQQADGVRDWRALDAGASAWFDAPSMTAGAALVRRIGELTAATGLPDVDLRPG